MVLLERDNVSVEQIQIVVVFLNGCGSLDSGQIFIFMLKELLLFLLNHVLLLFVGGVGGFFDDMGDMGVELVSLADDRVRVDAHGVGDVEV